MAKQLTAVQEFTKGLWDQNPVFKQVLGMCPTLAVTVSAINGIAMALATTFVLFFSSIIISAIRKLIPTQVRIASYILIIATFVTIVDLVMKAQFPELSKSLGPYIPLIVVNCLILGRQESFSSKNNPFKAGLDALGMGAGFLIALFVLGGAREILGTRTLLGFQVLPEMYEPWLIMILPAGAFLTLGLMMGLTNVYIKRKEDKEIKNIKNNFFEKKAKAIREMKEKEAVKIAEAEKQKAEKLAAKKVKEEEKKKNENDEKNNNEEK